MKTELCETIVEPIILTLKELRYERDSIERISKTLDVYIPGFRKAYLAQCKKERDQAIPQMKILADELETIYSKFTTVMCVDCKRQNDKIGDRNVGCCYSCHNTGGHFDGRGDLFENRTEIGKLKDEHGWSHVYGFLGEKGCVLPREKRSVVCLEHICCNAQSLLSSEENKRAREIVSEIRNLRRLVKAVLI